jgi:hypothetical protein
VGTLNLPASGVVYVDANSVIYTVEKHPTYGPPLQPLWVAAQSKSIEVVTSELALMETLVGPFKSGDKILEQSYERALFGTDLLLLPITHSIFARSGPTASRNETEDP